MTSLRRLASQWVVYAVLGVTISGLSVVPVRPDDRQAAYAKGTQGEGHAHQATDAQTSATPIPLGQHRTRNEGNVADKGSNADDGQWNATNTIQAASALVSAIATVALAAFAWFQVRAYQRQTRVMDLTFKASARAARAAGKSAEATEAALAKSDEMIAHAREAAANQLRAYVHAEKVTMQWQGQGGALFKITLKNSGQTPATFFEVGAIARTLTMEDYVGNEIPEDLIYGPWSALAGLSTHSGVLSTIGARHLSLDSLKKNPPERVMLFGRIRYRDIFEEFFETEFAFFSFHTGGEEAEMILIPGEMSSYIRAVDDIRYGSSKVSEDKLVGLLATMGGSQ